MSNINCSISIVITCFNNEKTIERAIRSTLSQENFDHVKEIIVVNDGSTDKSLELIQQSIERTSVARFISQPNRGAAAARNSGISESTGDFIAFLDGDDEWLPNRLTTFINSFNTFPKCGLFYDSFYKTAGDFINKSVVTPKSYTGDRISYRSLFVKGGPIIPTTVTISRAAIDDVGMFDTNLRYNEDPELWLRIARKYPLHHSKSITAIKHETPGSLGTFKSENYQALDYITNKYLSIDPFLEAHVNKRVAKLTLTKASDLYRAGQYRNSAHLCFRSIRNDPIKLKAYLVLVRSLYALTIQRLG